MASITYTKTAVCAGGEHVTLTRTGDRSGTRLVSVSDVMIAPTAEELLIAEMIMLRFFAVGKTRPQLNTAFTNGVTVSAV